MACGALRLHELVTACQLITEKQGLDECIALRSPIVRPTSVDTARTPVYPATTAACRDGPGWQHNVALGGGVRLHPAHPGVDNYSALFGPPFSDFGATARNHTAPRPCPRESIDPSLFKWNKSSRKARSAADELICVRMLANEDSFRRQLPGESSAVYPRDREQRGEAQHDRLAGSERLLPRRLPCSASPGPSSRCLADLRPSAARQSQVPPLPLSFSWLLR